MQPSIDMSSIVAALRRRFGANPGTSMPMQQQVAGQTNGLPTGGASTPMQAPPAQSTPNISDMQAPVSGGGGAGAGGSSGGGATNAALKAAGGATGPQFDPETREYAKALMLKLMKGL